jgi:PAS domain S-box-containing protein
MEPLLVTTIVFAIASLILMFVLISRSKTFNAMKNETEELRRKINDSTGLINERLRLSDRYSKLLATVADKTFEAVIITDPEGKIEWVNNGFTAITGYGFEEVRGKKPGSFLQGPETDRNTVDRIRQKLKERMIFKEEIVNYGKDGRKYWLSLSITPVLDGKGNVEKFIAIESDITQSKTEKEMLEKQLRAKQE